MRRLDSNLVSINGRVFERMPVQTPAGVQVRLNPMGIDLRPERFGEIRGATSPDTVRQVLDFLERSVNNGTFNNNPRALQLAVQVLNRNGRPITPGGGFGGGITGNSGAGGGPVAERDGEHGNGADGNGDPNVGDRRPSAAVGNVIGADGALLPRYCQDLHAAVCSGVDRRKDGQMMQSKAREVLGLFKRLFKVQDGVFDNALGGVQFAVDRIRNAAFPDNKSKTVFGNLMSFFQKGLATGMPTVESVRDALVQSIDTMDFPGGDAMKNILKDRARRTTIEFVPNTRDAESVRAFVEGCGPDGMVPSAFALPARNSLTVCPGLLLGGLQKGFNSFYNVLHVAAHELFHDLDIPFHGAFEKMAACFKEVFGPAFLEKQTAEAIADTGAAQVVGRALKAKSASEALQALRENVNILCFTTGHERDAQGRLVPGEHPSGPFRINNLIGRNPEIMKVLGCGQPTQERPACLAQGRVPPKESVR